MDTYSIKMANEGLLKMMIAFLMTLFAGLSTAIGGVLAIMTKQTNKSFLSVSLGFSAGVMIYVSMIEIMSKAEDALASQLGEVPGGWATAFAFFGGIGLIMLIDRIIPQTESTEDMMRMGAFTAIAISIHNFPEGLASFVSALQDMTIAVPIVVAIAIHNIPEGIAVAVPIYRATGSKKKAFMCSLLSGLAEPVGALVGWFLLMPIMSDTVFGVIFAGVAGIMVFIALVELLPAAREEEKEHLATYGMVAGMMVMAVSLLLFK